MDQQRTAGDEVSLVWLHQCNLFFPASIRIWVRSSTSGIRRDEVSMSRFSFSHLHSCISSSLTRSSCLRVSSSIIMWEQSTLRLAPRLFAHRRKDRHHNFLPLRIELARFQLKSLTVSCRIARPVLL